MRGKTKSGPLIVRERYIRVIFELSSRLGKCASGRRAKANVAMSCRRASLPTFLHVALFIVVALPVMQLAQQLRASCSSKNPILVTVLVVDMGMHRGSSLIV